MGDGERRLSLIATLQRLLAVVDRCHEPTDGAILEEWQRARAEAHMVLRREVGEACVNGVQKAVGHRPA